MVAVLRGYGYNGALAGDVLCAQDAFIRLRTGAMTMHTAPFANSDLRNSARDGQFYRLRYLVWFFVVNEW